jgi:hypothetical protein
MLSLVSLIGHQRPQEGLRTLDDLIQLRARLSGAAAGTHVERLAASALANAESRRPRVAVGGRADSDGTVRNSERGLVEEMTETLLSLGLVEVGQVARQAALAVLTSVPMTDVDLEVIQGLGDRRYLTDGLMPVAAGLLADFIDIREHHRGLAEKETMWAAGRLQDAGTWPSTLVREVPWFTKLRFERGFAKAPVYLPDGLYPGDPRAVYLAAAGRLAHSAEALRRAEGVRGEFIMRIIRGDFPALIGGRTRRQANIEICALFGMNNPTAVDYWRSRMARSS